MIIQVRGTSGSGKTTVMRVVMRHLAEENRGKLEAFTIEGRQKPLWYLHPEPPGTVILGHYEATCGGCDNVGSAAKVYELIQTFRSGKGEINLNVLCEGLLLSEDTKWTKSLHEEYPGQVKVLFLTTSLEACLSRVKDRRKEAGNDKPFNTDNTTNRYKVIERAREKLVEAGVYCRRVTGYQAPEIILSWIKPLVFFPRIYTPSEYLNGSGTKLDHYADGR